MGKDILAGQQIKVGLLVPGEGQHTAITHSQASFAKVLSKVVALECISEHAGQYNGVRFKAISDFRPEDYDVLHFQWGNNPLHLFEFIILLKLGSRRPVVVSTLHEVDLGYLVGASDAAPQYRRQFTRNRTFKPHPRIGSAVDLSRLGEDYDLFSYCTLGEIIGRSDCIIVHSDFAKRRLQELYSLSDVAAAKIRVGRLGVDLNEWRDTINGVPSLREPQSLPKMLFLYVGGLHGTKSVDKVIRAMHYVRHFARREDFYLVVVGTGPEYERLHTLSERLIPGLHHFTQFVPSAVPYYQQADVVLCPRSFSRGEISASIPEACAAGKPVILPSIGGWEEYIDASRGYLLPKDDELEYAEAIVECLQHPDEVKRRGQNGRRYAEEYLSWQAQTEFFLSIYSTFSRRSNQWSSEPILPVRH